MATASKTKTRIMVVEASWDRRPVSKSRFRSIQLSVGTPVRACTSRAIRSASYTSATRASISVMSPTRPSRVCAFRSDVTSQRPLTVSLPMSKMPTIRRTLSRSPLRTRIGSPTLAPSFSARLVPTMASSPPSRYCPSMRFVGMSTMRRRRAASAPTTCTASSAAPR